MIPYYEIVHALDDDTLINALSVSLRGLARDALHLHGRVSNATHSHDFLRYFRHART
jgi:hypothetical protein